MRLPKLFAPHPSQKDPTGKPARDDLLLCHQSAPQSRKNVIPDITVSASSIGGKWLGRQHAAPATQLCRPLHYYSSSFTPLPRKEWFNNIWTIERHALDIVGDNFFTGIYDRGGSA
jgi:hypothetical protein